MKKLLAVVLFALVVSPVLAADAAAPAAAAPAAVAPAAPAAPKAKKAPKAGDEAGIKAAFKAFSEGWAAGNAKTLSSQFLPDGSLINPFGQEANGRAEIEKLIGADLAMMKGSTHSFEISKVRFVLPGFALVDATSTLSGLKMADGTAAMDATIHVYVALAMRGSKWFIMALRPYAFAKPAAMMVAAPVVAAPAAPAAAAVPPSADKVTVPAAK
jgi:uncharacterized protein (TIGR02246 family)